MIDKFQKLFGPNATGTEANETPFSAASYGLPESRRNERARTRRRIFGFLAFVLTLAAVLPWMFEPNESFLQGAAKTEIPRLTRDTAVSQRMKIEPKSPKIRDESSKAAEVARNLSQANPQPVKKVKPDEKASVSATHEAAPKVRTPVKVKSVKNEKPTKVATKKVQKLAPIEMRENTVAASNPHMAYFIQILASSNKASAEERANRIRKLGLPVYIEKTVRHNANIWRVRVGRFSSQAAARTALDTLALNSIANGGIRSEKIAQK